MTSDFARPRWPTGQRIGASDFNQVLHVTVAGSGFNLDDSGRVNRDSMCLHQPLIRLRGPFAAEPDLRSSGKPGGPVAVKLLDDDVNGLHVSTFRLLLMSGNLD
jgi:hypothetical protein